MDERGFSTKSYTEKHRDFKWSSGVADLGEMPGGPGPLLFLDQLRPEGPKKNLETASPLPPLPRPLSQCLDDWVHPLI